MPNTTPSAAPRRGLIARLISRVLAPRPAPCEPSRLRRARFEALESRVLLSATPTLVGTPLDDNDSLPTQPAIYGTLGDDIIDGLAGDDLIFADGDGRFGTGGGRDIVTGGAGRDVIDGEAGNDWLEPAGMAAGPGMQKVYGGAGTDTLFLRGFPSDYRVFAYVDPETAIQGLLFEATTGDAIENRVGVFEMESIAFGAAVLDVADGSAAPQVTLSASGPFAVDDLVTATRGATRVVVDVAALYANDLNVGATPVLGGVSFTSADLTLDFATDAAGVTALGLDPAGYPLGAIVADLTAPLTRDRSFQYYFLDANGEFPPPATVTLRAELGQRFYFSGETASFGRELWLYDPASSLAGTGEPFATAIDEADTLAGGAGGNPQDITSLGNTVFWRGDSDVAGVVASRWHAYSPNLGYVALDAVADLLGFDSGATSPVLGLRSGDLFWGATGSALQAWREDGTAGASVTLAGNERRLLSDAGGVPAYAARDLDSGAEQLFAVLGAPAGSGFGLVQLTAGGDSGNRIDEIVALPVRTLAETTRTFYFTGVFGGESGLFAVTTLWDASAGTWSSLLAPRLLTGGADAEVVADAPSALTIARTGDAFSGLPEGLFFFGTDPGAGGQLYALADNAFGDTQVLVTGYLGAAFDGLEIRPWDNGVIFSGIAQFAASPDPFVATWTDADEDGQYDVALAFQAGSGTIEHLTVDGAGNAAFVFDGGGFDTLYLYRPDQLRTYAVVSGTGEIDEVRFAGGHLVYRMTEFGGGTDFYLFDHALATETGIQVRSDEFSGSVPGSGFVNDYRNVAIPGALVFDAARSDGGAPRALFVVNGANDVSFPAGGVLAESEGAVLDGAWVGTGLRADTADLGLFRIAADGTATTLYAASTNFSSEAEVLGRKVLFGTNSASVNDILVYDAATGTTTALLPSHLLGAAETVGSRIVFSALDFSRAVNADTDTANNRWTLYSYDGSAVTALLDLPTGGGGGQHVYEWGSAGDFLGDDSRLYWKQANDTTGVEVHSIDLTAADPGATLSILDIAADDISGADYRDAVFANGRLYWQASADGGFGQIAVWTTTNGADRTKVTGPDLRDPFGFPGSLVAIGGEVFFVGLDDATGTRGVFQINDDGITATRITPGGQFAAELAAAGGTLYFLGLDANGIEQLYSATPGTTPADLTRQALTSFTSPDGGMGDLFVGGEGRLYFGRSDPSTGRELWVVDAAEAQGARLVIDANTTPVPTSGPYAPQQVVPAPDPDPARTRGAGTVLPTPPVFDLSLFDFGQTEGTAPGAGATYDITVTRASGDLGASTLTLVLAGTGAAPASAGDIADGFITRTLDFLAGETSVTFTLQATPDALDESDETFTVALAGATFGTVNTTPVTVTIRDDDAAAPPVFQLRVGENVLPEGTGANNSGSIAFLVERDAQSDLRAATVTVSVAPSGANPIDAADLVSGFDPVLVTFAAGESFATFSLQAVPDSVFELDEALTVALAATTLGTVDATPVTALVFNDDLPPPPPPVFTLSLAESDFADEGTPPGGGGTIAFRIRRDAASDLGAATVTVSVGGTGTNPVSAGDLAGGFANREVVFAEGLEEAILVIAAVPDALFEANEQMVVALLESTLGSVNSGAVAASVFNDDLPPPVFRLTLTENVMSEGTGSGNGGFIAFSVARDEQSDLRAATVTVAVDVAGGNPIDGADLVSGFNAVLVTFAEGQSFAEFSLQAVPDSVFEPDEALSVRLVLTTLGTVDETALTALVFNDDLPPPPAPVFRLAIAESDFTLEGTGATGGGSIAFFVTRDAASDLGAATVTVSVGGIGTDPVDAADLVGGFANREVVFADGETQVVFSLQAVPDSVFEPNEQMVVALVGATLGTVNSAAVTPQIFDDDLPPPEFRLRVVENFELEGTGGAGGGFIAFDVSRVSGTADAATLTYRVGPGSVDPAAASDLVGGFGEFTIEFAPGQDFVFFSLRAIADALVEPDESIEVALVATTFGTVATTAVTALVFNDDQAPAAAWAGPSAGSVLEGTPPGAGAILTFTLVRSGDPSLPFSVNLQRSGTADATDIDAITGATQQPGNPSAWRVDFAAGQATATVEVRVRPDGGFEADDTVAFTITGGGSAGLAPALLTATGVILNDDAFTPIGLQATLVHRFDATPSFVLAGAARAVAAEAGFFYVANGDGGTLDVFTVGATGAETLIAQVDLSTLPGFGRANSVAAQNGVVAVSYSPANLSDPGRVAVFDRQPGGALVLRGTVAVGVLPEMVRFSPDGSALYVAVGGGQSSETDPVDPPGGVAVVSLAGALDASAVTFFGFSALDGQADVLRTAGVRLFPGKLPSVDFEPESIAIEPGSGDLLVTLQEANAVGRLNLATGAWTILPLGTVDHSLPGQEFDASDRDGLGGDGAINIANWPVLGLRMADGIASFEVGGRRYFVTANEGQNRDLGVADDAVRVRDLVLDPTAFPNAAALRDNAALGRLVVSTIDGDTDADGDYDRLFSFGSRSLTLFDASGNVVFESGEQFERKLADLVPARFNADGEDDAEDPPSSASFTFDQRSDSSGAEPEAVAVATIDGRTFAFIGLERDGGIVVYDVTAPAQARFVTYIDSRAAGDYGPEEIVVVPAAQSATGRTQIAIAYEYSGTTSVYDLVTGTADLSLAITLDTLEDEIVAGTDIDVLVRITNDGALTAGGSVRLAGAAGVQFNGAAAGSPGVLVLDFDPIAPGGFAELVVNTVFALPGTPDVVGEILIASAPDPDSTPGNGTDNGEDDTAGVGISVEEPVNDAPVGVADAVTTPFETPVVIDVVANDTDVDGDTIFAGGIALPANGALAFNAGGTITYTPNADFSGVDTFTYRPSDGTAQGNVTTVTVTVAPNPRYRLQLLHADSPKSGPYDADRIANFAAVVDALEDRQANSLTLINGDVFGSGLLFNAAGDPNSSFALGDYFGISTSNRQAPGRLDVAVLDALGVDAISLGNQDLAIGARTLGTAILSSGASSGWPGATFPVLAANLDVSGSTDLRPPTGGRGIAPSAIVEEGGEAIALIGLAPPLDAAAARLVPGVANVDVPGVTGLAELAAIVNAEVARLAAANPGLDKVVLLSHLGDAAQERALVPLLRGVDVVLAGGPGQAGGGYASFLTDADGNPVAFASTDDRYGEVGRLVLDFDANGVIVPGSLNPAVSGRYAATDAIVEDLWGDRAAAFAPGTRALRVEQLTDVASAIVAAQESFTFGRTDVFLEGRGGLVRTEETNLGNLVTDAYLAAGRAADPTVQLAIVNGGLISGPIGAIDDALAGLLAPPQAIVSAGKATGEISKLDIQSALRFNAGLTLVTIDANELLATLEHAVAVSGGAATPGRFAQTAGITFTANLARPAGDRINFAALTDAAGNPTTVLVRDGALAIDAATTFRIVVPDFLADGGDGYALPAFAAGRVDLESDSSAARTGNATFTADGTEQDVLAEYLYANFRTTPYAIAETAADADTRIRLIAQNRLPDVAPVGTQVVQELNWLAVDVDATDPDGDPLTYQLIDGPEDSFIDPDTGLVLWAAPALAPAGAIDFVVRVSDGLGFTDQAFSATVLPEYLRVTDFTPQSDGFSVRFNRVVDLTTLNLYDGARSTGPANLGPADVLLATLGGVGQPGTLLVDADQRGFAFLRTGAALAGGDYRATLVSGVSALRDLNGRTLDGDGDGAAGGNYVTTFKASPAPMQVSVGDVTRGPGQALNVPAAATGLPIRLAGAIPAGALAVTFELAYDPLLLEVTGAVSPAAGIAVGFTLIEPGLARIEVSIPGGLPAGGVIARLVATVPTAAPYGATHLLDVSDVRVNGAARGDDDGVHVVGYAGDATGEGVYSALDAQRILRVNTGADSGFAAWPLVDPVVVADITGDGRLTSLDAALVNLTAAGVNRPEVPVRSVPTPSLVFATFTPAADEPPPPPLFSFATVSTLEAQSAAPLTLTVEGSPSGAIERRLRTATLPTIEWKPVETVSSQRNAPRAGWLADFLGGKGFKPAKTQTWSVTAGR